MKTVYMCENEDEIILAHEMKPEGFTTCIEAPDLGFCDTSPLVGALCRHSCDPVSFPGVHHYVFDIDKHESVMYTDYTNCGDLDAVDVVNCTKIAIGDPARCYDRVVKAICAATCEDMGVSTGTLVKYCEVAHNDFQPVMKSWPRGAEVDWKETPTMAYTRSVYLHQTHTMKGPQVWEPCSTVGSLRNLTTKGRLEFIASDYFPMDTPMAPVAVKYVCGVPPSCPAMTSCVMSEAEFNSESSLIRKGIPFGERIGEAPPFIIEQLLTSKLWVDQMAEEADDWMKNDKLHPDTGPDPDDPNERSRNFGFGKIMITPTRALAVMRVKDYPYGKQVFLSNPMHTRVSVAKFPKDAFSFFLLVSGGADVDLLANFHYHAPKLVGYKGVVGDVIRFESFNKKGGVADKGPIELDILQPGITSPYGLKVLAYNLETKEVKDLKSIPGGKVTSLGGGVFRATIPPKVAMRADLLLSEDLDECATPESRETPCESYEDGGVCIDLDGYSECGCREGFVQMEKGPAAGQCLQTMFTPPGNTQTILLYPQDRLEKGWRINEIRVYEKYDPYTKSCMGMCPDGTMSPDCSYGVTVGSEPDLGPIALGTMSNLRTSKPYPLHYKEAAVDLDPKTAWWTYDFVVDRSMDTGGWYAFDVPAPRDPQCIRLSMAECEKVPEVMVVHKGVGKITEESVAYKSDNVTFPRPGWTESRVHGVSTSTVDLDIGCGTPGQYFGELLVSYLRVPSPCLCKQLCLDHVDEGCETWKWYAETMQCFLQSDIFVGDTETVDSPKSYKAGVRTEGLYLTSNGWWRRSFAPN